ncbi:MAG: ABC transporter permease [candidate division NC10 bacterium]|nr:ABC transporter permease [candidate division NC10 bacterium]
MLAYTLKRILATLPVMGLVVVFVFLLVRIAPGDPAAILAGDYATPENIQKIRTGLGLARPIHVQFALYAGNPLRGALGQSLHSQMPVRQLILQRLEPTVALAVSTLTFAVLLAIPLGILAAWRMGSLLDRAVMVFAVGGFSIPIFWLGFLLIYVFSIRLDLLPVQGYVSFHEGLVPFVKHLILPTLALGMVYMALLARVTRASVLEVLQSDYIRTAAAKGVPSLGLLFRHALKNAAVPVVTTVGVGFALLIGGVVITESVFALPGLGRLTVDAILQRDYSIIQGVTLIFAFAYALVNLVVDLSYTLFDPRIRY